MRGLKQDRNAGLVIAGYTFIQTFGEVTTTRPSRNGNQRLTVASPNWPW